MADEESFDEGFYRDMGESFDTRGDQSYHVNIWRDAFKLWIWCWKRGENRGVWAIVVIFGL